MYYTAILPGQNPQGNRIWRAQCRIRHFGRSEGANNLCLGVVGARSFGAAEDMLFAAAAATPPALLPGDRSGLRVVRLAGAEIVGSTSLTTGHSTPLRSVPVRMTARRRWASVGSFLRMAVPGSSVSSGEGFIDVRGGHRAKRKTAASVGSGLVPLQFRASPLTLTGRHT